MYLSRVLGLYNSHLYRYFHFHTLVHLTHASDQQTIILSNAYHRSTSILLDRKNHYFSSGLYITTYLAIYRRHIHSLRHSQIHLGIGLLCSLIVFLYREVCQRTNNLNILLHWILQTYHIHKLYLQRTHPHISLN